MLLLSTSTRLRRLRSVNNATDPASVVGTLRCGPPGGSRWSGAGKMGLSHLQGLHEREVAIGRCAAGRATAGGSKGPFGVCCASTG